MKKIVMIFLVVAMLLQFGVIGHAVTGRAEVAVTSVTAAPGETVTLTLTVSGSPSVRSMLIIPEYDGNLVELVSGRWLIDGAMVDDYDATYGDAVIAFSTEKVINGAVFELKFQVKNSAKLDDICQIGASVTINSNSGSVETTVAGGTITVDCTDHKFDGKPQCDGEKYWKTCKICGFTTESTAYILGDMNADGRVNMKDWNLMYEYISEIRQIDDAAWVSGDINFDGKLNMRDWNRLFEHVTEINPL